MKNVLLTSAAIVAFASAASAFEIAPGLSAGADVATSYTVDAQTTDTYLKPILSYGYDAFGLEISTDLAVYSEEWVLNDTTTVKPTLDFEATYDLTSNFELMGEMSYDLEAAERTDILITATLSF